MATQLEAIQKFMRSLDNSDKNGETALNRAVNAAFSTGLNSFQDVKDTFMTDLRGVSNSSVPHLKGESDVEYFLRVYCGIDFKTTDSGAITGSDAGNSKTKTDENIISMSGKLKTSFKDKSFSVNNLNVTLANKSFDSLNDTQQFIWQGLNTWWVKSALDLIANSYDTNFSFIDKDYAKEKKLKIKNYSSATTKELYVNFIDDSSEDKFSVECTSYEELDNGNAETTGITLTINTAYYTSLNNDNTEGKIEVGRAIAREMTKVVMMANLLYLPTYRSLPGFITEGLAELTIGITNSNADKIKALAADVTKYDVGLDANDLARDESFMYEGGYTFFRYLARQAGDLTIANSSNNTLLLTFYGKDTINNSGNNVTIQSGYNHDNITNSGTNVSIIGGNGSDTISNSGTKATIDGGDGNDSISNSGSNVTIDAGKGNDIISIQANGKKTSVNAGDGSDSITSGAESVLINGDAGSDTVYLLSAAEKNTVNGDKGKDYIYIYTNSKNHTIDSGEGDDTVHSEGTNISIETGDGKDLVQLYSSDSTAENNTINSGAGNDSIYSGGTNISVNAGDGDDYIHVYSYANNITIRPGTGNDTIESYCTDGFLYQYASGDGNDSIKGFSEKDTLKIAGSSYSTTKSGKNIIVKVDKNKITLEGAASLKKLNIGTSSSGAATLTVTNSTSSPVTVSSAVKVIDASSRTKSVKIRGNRLANTIVGGKGNDSIFGGRGNDNLNGGAGNDTLTGGNGNDTLTGGDGRDLFICKSGKNFIADYSTGDRISLGAAVTNTNISGSDVVFTMGNNSFTVKDAKGKTLKMINSSGKSFSTVIGSASSTTVTITDSNSSPVTVDSSVKVIDASSRTKAVKIKGNGLANTIVGGKGNDSLYGRAGNDSIVGGAGNDKLYGSNGNDILRGGKGNDTLWGDAGNDSLWGGTGDDTFVFCAGDGKDKIFDYKSGDMLKILKADGKTRGSFSKSKFSDGTLSLTISGGGSVLFENVTTSTTFNINNQSYKVKGSKLSAS